MPDLYSESAFAQNTRKTADTSKMGTRELSFHQVEMGTDVETGYTSNDSLYFKAVRALQEQVELYTVGAPDGQNFTVVIAADTCPFPAGQSNGDGDNNTRLEDIIDTACGTSCTVWNTKLLGNYLNNNC